MGIPADCWSGLLFPMDGFWGTVPAAARRLRLRDAELPLQHRRRSRRGSKMRRIQPTIIALCLSLLSGVAYAQAPKPDLTGVWGAYQGARGARGTPDPLGAVQAGTPALKPEYAKDYTAR